MQPVNSLSSTPAHGTRYLVLYYSVLALVAATVLASLSCLRAGTACGEVLLCSMLGLLLGGAAAIVMYLGGEG